MFQTIILAVALLSAAAAEYDNRVCNGVEGLCNLPLSLVTFPSTHNSFSLQMSVDLIPAVEVDVVSDLVGEHWENQNKGIRAQLEAGIRGLDMDAAFKLVDGSEPDAAWLGTPNDLPEPFYTLREVVSYVGGAYGSADPGNSTFCLPTWAHCSSDTLCSYTRSSSPEDMHPVATFNALAEFLASNPNDVLLIGMSDLSRGPWQDLCPDLEKLKWGVLRALGASSLLPYAASTVFAANATLGSVVNSGQRALFMFYDEWGASKPYFEVKAMDGSKVNISNQRFKRTTGFEQPNGLNDDGRVRDIMAEGLLPRLNWLFKDDQQVPFRVAGYFPMTCPYCRSGFIDSIVSTAKDVGSGIVETAKDVGDAVSDTAKDVWVGTKDVASDVASTVADTAEDVGGAVVDVAKDAGDKVADVAQDFGDKVVDTAKDAVDGVKDAANAVGDFFGGLFGKRRRLLALGGSLEEHKDVLYCGLEACAAASNLKAHLLYFMYEATVNVTDETSAWRPRLNVLQVNFFEQPVDEGGVLDMARQLNEAWVKQYNASTSGGELAPPRSWELDTCGWVSSPADRKAQLVCLHHGKKTMGLERVAEVAVPPGLGLWGSKGDAQFGPLCGGEGGRIVRSTRDNDDINGGNLDRIWVAAC